MVELDEKYALPRAQGEPAVDDRDGFACAEEHVLDMGVPVCALVRVHVDRATRKIVVFVVGVGCGEVAEGAGEVAAKQRLVLVDLDGGGGVLGEDADLAELYGGRLDDGDDIVGYVDELGSCRGFILQSIAEDACGRRIGAGHGFSARLYNRLFHHTAFIQNDLPKLRLFSRTTPDNAIQCAHKRAGLSPLPHSR